MSETYLLQHQFDECACVVCVLCSACVAHLSGIVWAITCTFVHGFQNNLAQFLSSKSRSVDRAKVKVTLEGQMIKWS